MLLILDQKDNSTSLDTCNTNETLHVMFYAEAEQTKNSTTLLSLIKSFSVIGVQQSDFPDAHGSENSFVVSFWNLGNLRKLYNGFVETAVPIVVVLLKKYWRSCACTIAQG